MDLKLSSYLYGDYIDEGIKVFNHFTAIHRF